MLVTFDTQEVVNELKKHGFTDEQAEVLTKIQKKVIHDSMDNTLASKGDINDIRNDINEVTTTLTNNILEVRTELANNISEVKTELTNNISEVRTDLKIDIQGLNTQLIVVKWMLGIVIAVEVLPFLKNLF
jgi:hypothetical protein